MLDYIRIACAVNPVQIGNVKKNIADICAKMAEADEKGCDLVVFPELCVTGYTCGDLFFQQALQEAAREALAELVAFSQGYPAITAVVGLPLVLGGQLYNCAAVISAGKLCGLVPKTYLPNHGAFCEKRWFSPASDLQVDTVSAAELGLKEDYCVPVGTNVLFRIGDALMGVDICEDLWSPVPPSSLLALKGAHIIVNPAASTAGAGKKADCNQIVKSQSNSGICAYAFCSAGSNESTADAVYSGHCVIAQNGRLLAQNDTEIIAEQLLIADVDLAFIRHERLCKTSFRDTAASLPLIPPDIICCTEAPLRSDGSRMHLNKLPFIPEEPEVRRCRCQEIFAIQVEGLKRRLSTINAKAVIGISGGLDSTLALLVAADAMLQLGRPLTDVIGITMPCFGTSDRTYNNAWQLMQTLGVSAHEIPIRDAVTEHFADIGQDPDLHDTTYENAQARERTQILMDFAGRVGGIVVGTGDLSELALGWCTYNGDHMSMYSVNGSVPKTLIPWIIGTVAEMPHFSAALDVLRDILDTPISPELLPPNPEGKISQQTEDIVGPYVLHDFFLFHAVRCGFTPSRIYTMACRAFAEDFDPSTVKKWLVNFYRRFFSQQFKRNCMPDGASVGSVSFSPRGAWHMPSDATAKLWLEEAESL